jgi:hypothetical protein
MNWRAALSGAAFAICLGSSIAFAGLLPQNIALDSPAIEKVGMFRLGPHPEPRLPRIEVLRRQGLPNLHERVAQVFLNPRLAEPLRLPRTGVTDHSLSYGWAGVPSHMTTKRLQDGLLPSWPSITVGQ